MAAKKRAKAPRNPAARKEHDVAVVIAALKKRASKATRAGMARYAIPADTAFGVPVGEIKRLAKSLGPSHALAEALWASGQYEARMLSTFVDEPDLVTPEQMDRWCKGFDNWAICDTACFVLFDRTRYAFKKVAQWSKSKDGFVKRAAFALLWGLTVHDKAASDEAFLRCLPLVTKAAHDERNFVKKAVNMALRAIGKRTLSLNLAAIVVAQRLAALDEAAPRWVGSNALRELQGSAVRKRVAAREQRLGAPATLSASVAEEHTAKGRSARL